MPLTLMYITNDPNIACIAQNNGVERVWVDLETLGKEKRQKGLNAVLSCHTVDDIRRIKPQLTTSSMLVRINPWHEGSKEEIEAVLEAGADIIMLPYWKSADEVSRFLDTVYGRCLTTLLLETKEAVECIDDVLLQGGFDEIHIGLNDLHLSYGLDFMFELLTNGTAEMLCRKFAARGIPYGFGGIAKIGAGAVPSEMIIMEHYRLGSTRAILSRSFCNAANYRSIDELDRAFSENMQKLRSFETVASNATANEFLKNKIEIAAAVLNVSEAFRKKKSGG